MMKDKVIVVTGFASGLGQACTRELAASGALLGVGDVNEAAGGRVADELRSTGAKLVFVPCDVSVAADASRLVARTVEEFGRLDGLLNNAGIEGNGTVETCTEEEWDRVLAVDLKGMFLCAKYALPHLRAAGGGCILNMASVSAFWGERGTVPYNAAKGGIIGMTRAMAMDHGAENIRVNCLCPGYHETGMPHRFFEAQEDPEMMAANVANLIALRRMGQPDDLARMVAFLLSDSSPYLTGATITLDGGMTAGYPWHM
jgi:NAD(P)-dependent dehydrogenase (short-subunit alcohol dehydrogenase family)